MIISIDPILDHLPAWFLVLTRITGIFIFSPIFGAVTTFRQARVMLALGLSLCVYPMVIEPGHAASGTLLYVVDNGLDFYMLVPLMMVELLIGYAIGWVASLPMIAMQMGGQIIDQQMGISAAGIFDPDLGVQKGVISELLYLSALAMFVIFGGHRVVLQTLVNSFGYIPIGGMQHFSDIVHLATGMLSLTFELAMKIAAPLLCLFLLEMLAMGFIARTVPQMNIFSVGFALKILMAAAVMMFFVDTGMEVFASTAQKLLDQLLLNFST